MCQFRMSSLAGCYHMCWSRRPSGGIQVTPQRLLSGMQSRPACATTMSQAFFIYIRMCVCVCVCVVYVGERCRVWVCVGLFCVLASVAVCLCVRARRRRCCQKAMAGMP